MTTQHTTYINGDLCEYTGNSEIVIGKTLYECKFMEGHRLGEIVKTYLKPGKVCLDKNELAKGDLK